MSKITFKDMISEDMAETYQRQIDMVQAERDRLTAQQEALSKKIEANGKKMDALRAQLDRYNKSNGKASTAAASGSSTPE